jgi:hypothetical protein
MALTAMVSSSWRVASSRLCLGRVPTPLRSLQRMGISETDEPRLLPILGLFPHPQSAFFPAGSWSPVDCLVA